MYRLTFPLLAVIVLLYLFLGWQYAVKTPAWQVPDEPAHYNYIRQLAEDRRLPVIKPGDWDSEYQNRLTSTGFDPQYTAELDRIEYEDHQPPLYYLLATPVYLLSNGELTILRLFSVLLGLGVVLCTFWIGYTLAPQQPWLALTAAGLVAFIPQHLAMLSGVNNDPLAELLAAYIFLLLIRYLQDDTATPCAALGLLVGCAFLTKSTIYFLAGIVGIAILLKGWRLRWSWQGVARHLGTYLLPALLLGGLWWGRNIAVYGGTDFLGLQRHDEVAAGQLQTDDYITQQLTGDKNLYYKNMLYTTFHSFWGQFGWMAVPMEIRIYRLLLVVCVGMLLGSLLYAWRAGWWKTLSPPQREILGLLLLSILLVLAAFCLYNRQFVQFQGRYLYPALIPLALWGALGITGWIALFRRRLPYLPWANLGVILALAALAWYALQTYLIPNLPQW